MSLRVPVKDPARIIPDAAGSPAEGLYLLKEGKRRFDETDALR